MPNHNLIAKAIRTHQIHLPETGHWWRSIHKFMERTIDEFWYSQFPYPILSMEETDGLSHYDPMDGIGLRFRINLNPFKLSDGLQAAEVLAHELVHLHEDLSGVPTLHNQHTSFFHEEMFIRYGIATKGESGEHVGHSGKWEDWLEENMELELAKFKFEADG